MKNFFILFASLLLLLFTSCDSYELKRRKIEKELLREGWTFAGNVQCYKVEEKEFILSDGESFHGEGITGENYSSCKPFIKQVGNSMVVTVLHGTTRFNVEIVPAHYLTWYEENNSSNHYRTRGKVLINCIYCKRTNSYGVSYYAFYLSF